MLDVPKLISLTEIGMKRKDRERIARTRNLIKEIEKAIEAAATEGESNYHFFKEFNIDDKAITDYFKAIDGLKVENLISEIVISWIVYY